MTMKGKVAIIAGGGRDIGRACAIELASKGVNVVLTYHSSAETAQSAVKEIEALGAKAIAIQADLTSATDVKKTLDSTLEAFGKVDILVHVSGGLLARVTIDEMSVEHWDNVMDVNLKSLFMMCNAVIPHLSEGSAIVTFSSQAARDGGGPGSVAYAASKGAVTSFMSTTIEN